MSWKTLNQILSRAVIEPKFWQDLQKDALKTLRSEGYKLTPDEQAVFVEFVHLPLALCCQHLLEKLAPEEWY